MQWRSVIGGFASRFAGLSSRKSFKSSAVSLSRFQVFCMGLILSTLTLQLAVQLSEPNLYNTKHASELQQPMSSALHGAVDHHFNGCKGETISSEITTDA